MAVTTGVANEIPWAIRNPPSFDSGQCVMMPSPTAMKLSELRTDRGVKLDGYVPRSSFQECIPIVSDGSLAGHAAPYHLECYDVHLPRDSITLFPRLHHFVTRGDLPELDVRRWCLTIIGACALVCLTLAQEVRLVATKLLA